MSQTVVTATELGMREAVFLFLQVAGFVIPSWMQIKYKSIYDGSLCSIMDLEYNINLLAYIAFADTSIY